MIREFEPTDAAAVSAALHEEDPPHPVTPDGVLHWRDGQPERAKARLWVAEEAGRIVGWGEARIRWTTKVQDVGDLWGYVVPSARGRGLGRALYTEVERYLLGLGARVLESWTYTAAGEGLLENRGFRATGTEQVSTLDPARTSQSLLRSKNKRPRRASGSSRWETCASGSRSSTASMPRPLRTCPSTSARTTSA
jgi:GNAT superfamily N-acetyltransferase